MNAPRAGADVLVVGAGVIGCAVARELALSGLTVTVVDRATPGQEATWAAAGMLTPQGEGRATGPFLSLCMESLALYRDFAAALDEETGVDVGYRPMETLVAGLDEAECRQLRDSLEAHRKRGARVRWLEADDIQELESNVAPTAGGGLLFENEGQVDNRALGQALWAAAERAGVRVKTHTAVVGVQVESGRARGLELGDETLHASTVVVAAGAWSGRLGGLPRPLPVRPVRGQMVALGVLPLPLERLLSAGDVYLVPRAGGRLLVGATLEDAGFRAHPTAGGIAGLLDGAVRAVPSLADAPLLETWAGLRPGTPDGLPVLGPDPEVEGLYYATGHYRNGILLTPVTARVVADAITGATAAVDLTPYAPDRFQ